MHDWQLGQTVAEFELDRRYEEQLNGMGRRSNESGTITTSLTTQTTDGDAPNEVLEPWSFSRTWSTARRPELSDGSTVSSACEAENCQKIVGPSMQCRIKNPTHLWRFTITGPSPHVPTSTSQLGTRRPSPQFKGCRHLPLALLRAPC